MYDWPAIRHAHDAFWTAWRAAIADRGLATAPERLDWNPAGEMVINDLFVGQVCGITYRRMLRGRVHLVATPCYAALGCVGPNYCSMIVVRRDDQARSMGDLADTVAAVNSETSYSGWNALQAVIENKAGFFRSTIMTGSHLASALAVVGGHADCAAIDSVCWSLMGRHEPDIQNHLRVLCQSPRVPGLPFIAGPTCSDEDVAVIRAALFETMADPAMSDVLDSLLLTGAEQLHPAAYDQLETH